MQRVRLSSYGLEVAKYVAEKMPEALNEEIAGKLLTENLRVDFRMPAAGDIYLTCLRHLVKINWIT
jgi:hypothetical protein